MTAGSHARLRSMQTLLDTLMARARDQTSWTRACVCRTWASLAEHGKVPMGHWNAVADVAIGAALSDAASSSPCIQSQACERLCNAVTDAAELSSMFRL